MTKVPVSFPLSKLNSGTAPIGRVLSVDPGVEGTGIAVWRGGSVWELPVTPIACGNLYCKNPKDEWFDRAHSLVACYFGEVYDKFFGSIEHIYIEYPQYFDSLKGKTSAKTGDLLKLGVFVGMIVEASTQLSPKVTLVPVNVWKGQLPKKVVEDRIKGILPSLEEKLNPKSHSWDAIGIGLWAKGLFKDENSSKEGVHTLSK